MLHNTRRGTSLLGRLLGRRDRKADWPYLTVAELQAAGLCPIANAHLVTTRRRPATRSHSDLLFPSSYPAVVPPGGYQVRRAGGSNSSGAPAAANLSTGAA